MSTLHQLQGFTASGATTLLPNSSTLTINRQFANDFGTITNMGWPPQSTSSVWLERAKVAAMLPVYSVFSSGTIKSTEKAGTNVVAQTKEVNIPNKPVVSTPPFTPTTNSGIFPLNPVGLAGSAKDIKPQQSSPLNFCPELQAKDISPSGSVLNSDPQPSSVQNHSVGEIGPCSSSAVFPRGPASVPVCSTSGMESVILRNELAPNTPVFVQTDVVSIKPVEAAYDSPVISSVPFTNLNKGLVLPHQ